MAAAGPELDADRVLALAYVPAARRAAVEALWRLDAALGQVLAGGREPLISRIKLAWWRDALVGLGDGRPPAEPVLEAVAAHVRSAGIRAADLALMEEGWAVLLAQDALGPADLALYARRRGGMLFNCTAQLLGRSPGPETERAGEGWALIDLARRSGNEAEVDAAVAAAAERLSGLAERSWPSPLRPLGMLAALAARDVGRGADAFEPHGAPGRMLRMLTYRLAGR
ncbi:MAG TPA: squalene/phytoene synthase family protein [Allosphingosinicella sp.]|nr:squalene/phytoene synthase family protein [Allosphingosinicella sp.]